MNKERTVLVLNRSWMPIGITDTRNAIKRICRNTKGVRSIAPSGAPLSWDDWISLGEDELYEDQPYIYSARDRFPIPTILLTESKMFKKSSNKIPTLRDLCDYFDNKCQICGKGIIPTSKGGVNRSENLTLACKKCNNSKSDIYPFFSEDGSQLQPFTYDTHFRINKNNVRKEWKPFIIGHNE